MKLGRLILPLVALLSCPTLAVGQLDYTKGQSRYSVGEEGGEYVVTYYRSEDAYSSRNRNIEERRRRMEVVDLMGAYQLYLAWCDRNDINMAEVDLFQIFTDAIGYHYDAEVYGIKREERGGASVFRCAKKDFVITEASFPIDVDLVGLVRDNYATHKDAYSAAMLYAMREFSPSDYISMMHDFLSGRAVVDGAVRTVQKSGELARLENSLYTDMDPVLAAEISGAEMQLGLDGVVAPYGQFAWIDMVTTAAPADKARYYQRWKESLHNDGCVWEDMLLYVAQCCTSPLPEEFPTVSEAIAAFPGAISPYGVRLATDKSIYAEAERAYAASNVDEALRLLGESLNNEGVSNVALNLMGAAYRFSGEPSKGIPYLILGFMIDAETRFLVGNLVQSLDAVGYPRTSELAGFLLTYAKVDSWSKGVIEKIISQHPQALVIE